MKKNTSRNGSSPIVKRSVFVGAKVTPEQKAEIQSFDNGSIKGYDEFEEALKSAYANAGVKLGHNKLVKLITFLKNKRMVVMENNIYHLMPDFHY